MKVKYRNSYNCIIAFMLTFALLLTACAVNGLAPFGGKTWGSSEEYDIIAYIKAVLEGRQKVFYSFSGSAGSGVFYRISEMLFSPFNLIMALSQSSDFNSLYDIFMVIRISLASAAFAAYVNFRYFGIEAQKKDKQYLRHISCVAVSVLYAVSSAVLTGGSVTVTGLIFLPLILLGVYKITTDKGAQMFLIPLLLNLIINWYTGIANAAVAVIWLIFEIAFGIAGSEGFVKHGDIKAILSRVARFIISLGLALSTGAFVWYTTYKLLPAAAVPSTQTVTSDIPGVGVIILGLLSLLVYICLTNSNFRMKIVLFVFTGALTALVLIPDVSSFLAGSGRLDAGIRQLKYIPSFLMAFLFCQMFLSGNNYNKRPYVLETASSLAGILLIVQLVTGVFVPMNRTFADEAVSYDYDHQAVVEKMMINAVKELDKGTYRIGFVSEDLKEVTLLSSSDDYIYFDEPSDRVDQAGDIIASLYPYGVRYLISKADLTGITGGGEPLGEYDGMRVYYNPYSPPLAFIYDGSYFDAKFRESDAGQRILIANSAREHIPSGLNVKADDIKFSSLPSQAGMRLFISVPVDPNMTLTLNGIKISPAFYSGKFYSVDLQEGQNTVTMEYQPEFWDMVVLISFVSLLLLVLFIFIENFYDMHYPH